MECSFIHAGPADEGWVDEAKPPLQTSRLMQLTNHKVTQAAREDEQRLKIDWEHGHALTLLDDDPRYEAFTLDAGGRLWVV